MALLKKSFFLTILFLIKLGVQAQDSIKVENLGEMVNSEYAEIAPVISPDGKTIYFVRLAHPQNTNGAKESGDIWFSEFNSATNKWSRARRMPSPLNRSPDGYNQLYSITPDGNSILIKGAFLNGRYETRGVSMSLRKSGGWSAPQKLNIIDYEKISKGEFDAAFLSNDGKTLLLSFSKKKKSIVDDIYVSFKQKNDTWSRPESIGKDVNTEDFTETTPFLASDGVTLYFSSNRTGGAGSNDIYMAKRLDRTWKKWSKPVNLGPEINTKGYDGYYSVVAGAEYAYLMSYGTGNLGKSDIVRIALPKPPPIDTTTKKPEVIAETKAAAAPDPVVMLSGKVSNSISGKAIDSKIVYGTLPDGEEVGSALSSPVSGEFKIVLPYGKNFWIRAEAPGYIAEEINIDLMDSTAIGKGKNSKEIVGRILKLVPIEEGSIVRLNNIFFESSKSLLRPESIPELKRMVLTMTQNSTMRIELGGHTDNLGSDLPNLKLSQERADVVRDYLVSQGIQLDRIQSRGYGETRPVATNLTAAGRQENRRVEFLILKK